MRVCDRDLTPDSDPAGELFCKFRMTMALLFELKLEANSIVDSQSKSLHF